jgi:hypothetical protein
MHLRAFLSWSGEASRRIAVALRQWLPRVLPRIEPWMSEHDIQAGERWSSALAAALAKSRFAIVILTSNNANAPWVLFEAGALSRAFKTTSVVPYLIDIQPADLAMPLLQFQARPAERLATLDLVRRLNAASDVPTAEVFITEAFREHWPSLLRQISLVRATLSSPSLSVVSNVDPNAKIIPFERAIDFDLYLASRIGAARHEVCDLTWKDVLSSTHDLQARRRALREYERMIVRAARNIPYREIFIFNDRRRIEKLQRRLSERVPGYSCRYFDITATTIPRVQFVLIDNDEVAFGPTGSNIRGMFIISQDLNRLLKGYFEDSWQRAIPIKEGKNIDYATVNKIVSNKKGA